MLSSATLPSSTCGASRPSTTKFVSHLLRFHITNWKLFCGVTIAVCVTKDENSYHKMEQIVTLAQSDMRKCT
jgi:hypothetical protein